MIRTQETLFSIWCENGSLCNSECIIQYGQWNFGCFHDIFLHVEVPWKFHDSCQIAECCGWKPGNPMAQGPGFGLGTPSHGPLSLSGYSIFRSFLEEGKIH